MNPNIVGFSEWYVETIIRIMAAWREFWWP